MNTVAFLVYTDTITILRFIMVAAELATMGVSSTFICLTPRSRTITRQILERECPNMDVPCHNFFLPLWRRILHRMLSRISAFCFRGYSFRLGNVPSKDCRKANEPDILADLFDFNIDVSIGKFCSNQLHWWHVHLKQADGILQSIRPGAVVYDVELVDQIRMVLLQSLRRQIPIISMQHGEGFGEQYLHFPVLADHYIAYSPYNVDKIRSIGVEETRIHLTGNPDTDRLYRLDAAKIRNELETTYGLDLNRTIVLVALRPSYDTVSRHDNTKLIRTIVQELGSDDRFLVLVKPHNSDHVVGLTPLYTTHGSDNVLVLPADFTIAKLIRISHYQLTHMSSCIVEGVLLGLTPIVIASEDGGTWPPWHEHDVYVTIPPESIAETLRQIKSGTLAFRYTDQNREKFVHRFRYRMDDRSSNRVATTIRKILHENQGIPIDHEWSLAERTC